jgi:L,D-peptidoglycan transpeptidase YkuD (ErfK/YbiS/YcfS/YnhG family)
MSPLPAACRQLLLCLAADGEASAARLQRFARQPAAPWQAVGAAVPVMLGRAGLAWGRGLHAPVAGGLPDKREGDGRAPAGVFAISELFGTAAPDSAFARAAKLPYRQATADLKAIDDPASVYYNRIVDQATLARPDWASCEDMLRADERYAIGAVVAHNSDPVVPGAGSCIFMHVWAAPEQSPAGWMARRRRCWSSCRKPNTSAGAKPGACQRLFSRAAWMAAGCVSGWCFFRPPWLGTWRRPPVSARR